MEWDYTIIPSTTNVQKEKQGNSNPEQQSSTWEYVLSQFHKNILLRHYSPRTEKSYRIWRDHFTLCLE